MMNKTTTAAAKPLDEQIIDAAAELNAAVDAHANVIKAKYAAAGITFGVYDRAFSESLRYDAEINAAYDRITAAQKVTARLQRRAHGRGF